MRRQEKVANAIKEEVSTIIQCELRDPRLGFITIIRVDLSKDLKHAKIYYSVLGNEESIARSQKGLNSASGYIKRLLCDRLKLRIAPEISFKLDRSAEYSIYISEKIESLKKEKEEEE